MPFPRVVGNEAAKRLLWEGLTRGELPPVILFVGQRGIGKFSLGLELAKAVECETRTSEGACGSCEPCRKIEEGTFPEVRVFSPGSESRQMGIDQIRALSVWLSTTGSGGFWKVALLDEVDQLTEEGAHACLKLLEEPPAKSLLLLVAQNAALLAPPLISRCHLVRCVPQGLARVAAALIEGEGLSEENARMLAAWSDGRLGQALRFHRENRLHAKNEAVDQLLGALKGRAVELPLGNAPRREIEEALQWLAAWWRDLILIKLGGDTAWLFHQDRRSLLTAHAKELSLERLLDFVRFTYEAKEAITANASPRMALAALLSR